MRGFRPVDSICARLTQIEFSPLMLVLVPAVIAGGRGVQEELMFPSARFSVPYLNYVLCYGVLSLQTLVILSVATQDNYKKFGAVASVGLLLGWLPVPLDGLLGLLGFDQEGRWYLYFKTFEWSFFADNQMLGESITIWVAIGLTTFYVMWYTRHIGKTLLCFFLSYAFFQVSAFFLPALATSILGHRPPLFFGPILNWVYLITGVGFYCLLNLKTLSPSLQRAQHALPFGLLAAIGARIAGQDWCQALGKCGTMFLAAVFAIVVNDYFDREMDASAGGRARPVTFDDMVFFSGAGVALVAQVHVFNPAGFVLCATFTALWFCYHAPTLRLKRFLGVPYLFEGVGAALCFLYGVRWGTSFPADPGTVLFALLVLGGFFIGSFVKDYKDIDQDRASGVSTVYTFMLSKTGGIGVMHNTVCILLAVCLILPVLLLLHFTAFHALSILLLALAVLPSLLLKLLKSKKRAVAFALWTINGYLGLVALEVPRLL